MQSSMKSIGTEAAAPSLPSDGGGVSAGEAAPRYLADLNPPQREAVETLDGPVLILAGAGTGKTKALTARIAHILRAGRAWPWQILAVTFTNKAAREMRGRVSLMVGDQVEGMPWLGTFHSICAKILRRHAELAGLESNFTILDKNDQERLLKQLITAVNIDEKKFPARSLAAIIDRWKNQGWMPEDVPNFGHGEFNGRGHSLYEEYQNRLVGYNATDFGDLILRVVDIFRRHEDVLIRYQHQFRYILVDEYQDTNVAQYLWLKLLAQAHRNICCVGDDDQSIYGWRGANVNNILQFERNFPGAKVIKLEQNYRSTTHILGAASGLIDRNAGRLGKTLWTDQASGEKVRVVGHWEGQDEARWIGAEAENLNGATGTRRAYGYDEMAILVRASFQMREIEDRLMAIGLPYRVIGGPRFYERREVRDAIAYFRFAVSKKDDIAFERIVNVPKRGVGEVTRQKINLEARHQRVSLCDAAAALCRTGQITGKAAAGIRQLLESQSVWSDLAEDTSGNHIEAASQILEESGLPEMWTNTKTPDALGRLENLKELIKALEEFDNIQGLLEHVALHFENLQNSQDRGISIMTLHSAKGLEFPIVFLPGWEEGVFPLQRAMEEEGDPGLEEERRLAYVGITRTMEICTISFAAARFTYGRWRTQDPSRFVGELPAEHIDDMTPSGLTPSYSGFGFEAAAGSQLPVDWTAGSGAYSSPGFQRMVREVADGANKRTASFSRRMLEGSSSVEFKPGDRVFHQKFGYGTVTAAADPNLSIEFDKAGTKKVRASYVGRADGSESAT